MGSFPERYNDPGLFATETCLPYSNGQEDSGFLKQNSGFHKQKLSGFTLHGLIQRTIPCERLKTFFYCLMLQNGSVRPQFTTYPEPVDATVPQKPVVFKCQARGSPAPAIKWFKDDLLIVGTPEESRFHITMEGSLVFMGKRYHITREGSLVIFDPRVEDEGTYKCQAENALGQVSYGVSLYVEMGKF